MKKLLLAALCSLSLQQSFAQITLTQADAPTNVVGTDTIYNTVNNSAIPNNIGPGTSMLWDFSTVTYLPALYLSVYNVATGFANASFTNKAYYQITPTTTYETNMMFSITAQGVLTYGERLSRQAFQVGTNLSDSVIVNAQDVVYALPLTQVQYPLSYNGSWSSTSRANVDLTVKSASLGGIPIPAQRRSSMAINSAVIGWGNLMVKSLYNLPSGKMQVLEVQTISSSTDSFYINGSPAPPTILTQMNITQGQTSFVYTRNFYRKGEIDPIVSVSYNDAGFTQLKDVNVQRHRVPPFDASVKGITGKTEVKLYPNPATSHMVNIELNNTLNETCTYELLSVTGQTVASQPVDFKSGKAIVTLPTAISAGRYFIKITDNNGAASAASLMIQ